MNPLQIILALIGAAPDFMKLITAIVAEVHNVQAEMRAAAGSDKQRTVLDRVNDVAVLVGAETPHVTSLINQVVAAAKATKIGAFADANEAATAAAGG
jgi:mitochondrial fission protein ELM1